jgi:ABC-type uncharacterized transport system substrate-binding protein
MTLAATTVSSVALASQSAILGYLQSVLGCIPDCLRKFRDHHETQPLPSLRVEVSPVNVRDAGEIERAIAAFSRSPNGGMVVTASAATQLHRDLIITLAARHKLPAAYPNRFFVAAGGLISYAADFIDQYRRAAGYVDRILKGERAADLPVQAPTKYELVINLKTAKALGLEIPATVLARADEVVE